jgi:hypothetical protein
MNNIARRALLLVLLGLSLSLFAASPERLIGGTVSTPAPNSRGGVVVATDGTDFFVVWADYRSPDEGSVVGTRVTREGRVLDPLGIRIATAPGGTTPPHIAWDGGAYLVVWAAPVYGNGIFQNDFAVHAARIDSDGRFVMQPHVVAEHAMTANSNAIASNGNVSVIPYRAYQYPYENRIVALDRDGNTLRHESLPAAGIPQVLIAATPSRFLVAWSSPWGLQHEDEILAVELTGDGHLLAGAPVRVGFGIEPAIGTDGTRFLIVSSTVDPELGRWTVQARVVDPGLTIGAVQTLITGYEIIATPILWRNGRYEVLVNRRPQPSAPFEATSIDVDTDGHAIGTRTRDRTGRAATNGTDVLVAFGGAVSTTTWPQLFAAVYRGNSTAADVEELLSWSGNGHTNPVIAASAAGHLVAWNEESGVYFTRVDTAGNSLDGRGVPIAPKSAGPAGFGVRATFDGTNYVVAWIENDAVGVRWIAPATGATVAEVRVPATVWAMALAASHDATYVVFADERLRVIRIPHATRTPDPVPLAISPEDMPIDAPAAAWNGSTLLVVWNEMFYPIADPPIAIAKNTLGARVTAGLSLLDPAPLFLATIGEGGWAQPGAPSVASNGDDWLVVTDLGGRDILARRVLHDGTVAGNGAEKIASGSGPVVTWDGTRYAVGWKDGANVFLGAVSPTSVPALTRQTLVTANIAPSALSIAPAANGEAAVTYTKLSFRPEHSGVERTFLRFMDYGAPRGRVIRK